MGAPAVARTWAVNWMAWPSVSIPHGPGGNVTETDTGSIPPLAILYGAEIARSWPRHVAASPNAVKESGSCPGIDTPMTAPGGTPETVPAIVAGNVADASAIVTQLP